VADRPAGRSGAKMGRVADLPSTGAAVTGGPAERENPGERRYAAAAAIVVAIALYAALPNPLILGPRLTVPVLEVALFVPLMLANPHRMTRESVVLRWLSMGLTGLILVANSTALVLLVERLVNQSTKEGSLLLLGAGQVWVTNMIAFALAFWELDRGGPVARTRVQRHLLPAADFRFPQDEDHDAIVEVAVRSSMRSDWTPAFLDYLYVSITNSSAFSPTDTMPLSHRAKMLMALESVSALVLSVIVIARGVSLLQ
jgi:hypothetical protein